MEHRHLDSALLELIAQGELPETAVDVLFAVHLRADGAPARAGSPARGRPPRGGSPTAGLRPRIWWAAHHGLLDANGCFPRASARSAATSGAFASCPPRSGRRRSAAPAPASVLPRRFPFSSRRPGRLDHSPDRALGWRALAGRAPWASLPRSTRKGGRQPPPTGRRSPRQRVARGRRPRGGRRGLGLRSAPSAGARWPTFASTPNWRTWRPRFGSTSVGSATPTASLFAPHVLSSSGG